MQTRDMGFRPIVGKTHLSGEAVPARLTAFTGLAYRDAYPVKSQAPPELPRRAHGGPTGIRCILPAVRAFLRRSKRCKRVHVIVPGSVPVGNPGWAGTSDERPAGRQADEISSRPSTVLR